MDLYEPNFSDSRDPIRVPKTPLKNLICCIHCDFMLPVRKNFLSFLPVHECKKVENH